MTTADLCAIGSAAFGDLIAFPIFQGAIFLLLVYAFVKDRGWFRRSTGLDASVTRGKESWALFPAMFGLLALVVVEVNNTTEAWKGYKTITTLADIAALFYLCYFNGWFRNKTVGIIIRSRQLVEK